MVDETQLRAAYDAAGQSHVFAFWDRLNADERETLLEQLSRIDPEHVNRIVAKALEADAAARNASNARVEPPPADSIVATPPADSTPYRARGLEAVGNGEVGVLLLAGGQGTRLGSSAPKGCYDIGLPSGKSLFQLQAERIARLQTLAAGGSKPVVPWYIMTSGPTRAATESFFAENNYFGLDKSNVVFFEQGTLPCISNEGKIMLDAPGRVATAPDGNGGLYAALRAPLSRGSDNTVLKDLESRGIKYLHAYGVDNCLVKVGDPVFIGVCIEQKVAAGVKVVRKTDPSEAVGVVALRDGRFGVVEYSEIPEELAQAREASGELQLRAANIANHFYTTEFLARDVPAFESEMAYHVARKKIPTIDENGERFKPNTPNGIKLELFIFDVFPHVDRLAIHEVPRSEEFSPLKNAPGTGTDDPQTSRRDLLAQQRRWLTEAGATVAEGADVELSPLVTYAGEGLEKFAGKSFESTENVTA
ncbi:hypothetical protein MCUN1_001492 [Malassezia cuniculi]|uniref:UDP-N-acetylglucosamine diphosphorylase n=1 Tax=Malassezia cuniculi TaxID=948313 RepID=A0AAF0JAU2_9BASI|nr:hypothetical protein MCUN1_001492 [Malassezia cuniculi]